MIANNIERVFFLFSCNLFVAKMGVFFSFESGLGTGRLTLYYLLGTIFPIFAYFVQQLWMILATSSEDSYRFRWFHIH